MTPAQKAEAVEVLKDKFSQYDNFYLTDTESLSVSQISKIRGACFDKEVEMRVAKNTLIKRALDEVDSEKYNDIYDALKGVTALMFSDTPKSPGVIISDFRKDEGGERPILKAAFVANEIYMGDEHLANLKNIKTKDELIGEVVTLLQSPMSRVLSALENKPEDVDGSSAKEDPKDQEEPKQIAKTEEHKEDKQNTNEEDKKEEKSEQ